MSKNFLNNQSLKHTFKRKQVSKPLPLSQSSLTKNLDDFIQSTLNSFKYIDVPEEMIEITSSSLSKHLLNNKPVIPDLVIYNTTFNKNDCFLEGIHCSEYNTFPRMKFEIKVKPLEPVESSEIEKYSERFNNKTKDEEEIEWEDVNVKELEKVHLTFQKIPGKDNEIKIAEHSKIINVNSLFGVSFPLEQTSKEILNTTTVLISKDNVGNFDPFKEESLETNNNLKKKSVKINDLTSQTNIINKNIPLLNPIEGNNKDNSKSISTHKNDNYDSLFSDLSLINIKTPSQSELNYHPQINESMPYWNEINKELFRQDLHNKRLMNPNVGPMGNHLMNNFPMDNKYFPPNNNNCPENFLEDPLYLVKRNVNIKGWYIKENDKIMATMNSYDLLIFLENRMKNEKMGLKNLWIFDSMSDIYYTPMTLYEVLRENINLIIQPIPNMYHSIQSGNSIPFNNNIRRNQFEDYMMSKLLN